VSVKSVPEVSNNVTFTYSSKKKTVDLKVTLAIDENRERYLLNTIVTVNST